MMADIGQALASGGWAIVGVVVGASLTYWFGALNRRHQEAREDRTRWYGARLEAYAEFHRTVYRVFFALRGGWPLSKEDREGLAQRLTDGISAIGFVGSDDVTEMAYAVYYSAREELEKDEDSDARRIVDVLNVFETAARKDLGHPEP
jgi:hypothetical protein